ncbi:uncharacterized protein LOC110852590 isoform X1 [Folsomia candida]|uniref:uncharacterized protein LOC110852590 isoform X1 n=1 Tax=Folsomia candida TaxID=158441 RepID=UPI001604F3AF|nr:uncharacterized protein LOC110852590 isoform X1 [Folsomia candida]
MSSLFESFRGVFRSRTSTNQNDNDDNASETANKSTPETKTMVSESVEADLDSGNQGVVRKPYFKAPPNEDSPYVSEVNSAQLSFENIPPGLVCITESPETGILYQVPQGLPPRQPLASNSHPNRPKSATAQVMTRMTILHNEQAPQQHDTRDDDEDDDEKWDKDDERMATLMAQIPCQITQSGHLFSKSFTTLPKPAAQSRSSHLQMSKKSSTRVFYNMAEIGVVPRPQTSPQFPTQSSQLHQTVEPDHLAVHNDATKVIDPSQTSSTTAENHISSEDQENKLGESDTTFRLSTSSDHHNADHKTESELLDFGPPAFTIPIKNDSKSLHKLPTSSRSESSETVQSIVANIISEEGDDFKERYSEWIADTLHERMDKMRQRLNTQFNSTMEQLKISKDEEIQSLHQFYKHKLKLAETSSHQFQQLIRSMEAEHRRTLQGKDDIILKLSNELGHAGQNFVHELEKQRTLIKAEVEREKTELVTQQGENIQRILGTVADTNATPLTTHGDSSLFLPSHMELTTQNDWSSQDHVRYSTETNSQMDFLYEKIANLQKTLESLTQEKELMSKLHSENLSSIMSHSEQSIQELTKQLQAANDKLANLKKRHEREIKDAKVTLLNKETLYNKTFIELKRKYGDKIDGLSKIIQKIESTYA